VSQNISYAELIVNATKINKVSKFRNNGFAMVVVVSA
jgi:hypothetical protein